MNKKLTPHATHLLVSLAVLSFGASDALAIGYSGAPNWVDTNCAGKPLTDFNIRPGGRVDGLQFGYRNGGWAPAHGSTGGTPIHVSLDADETFTEVRYRSGSSVDQLTFVSSKGRIFGPYGGGGGTPGVAKGSDGASLSCVSGTSGGSIDQLVFSWLPATSKVSDKPKKSGMTSSANCTASSYATGSGDTSGGNVQGGASVGSGVVCTNTTGYADQNGYANVQLSCQSGMFANAEGQAGANGVAVCADASVGTSCSATVAGGGTTQYGGGGGSVGSSVGGTGAGTCGGVTFTKEAVNIAMCGTIALDVGVDVCINGNVNYANIYGRAEPFASRAVAQAARCANSSNGGANCGFTVGDMLANSAAPYVGRTADFFDSSKKFRTGAAIDVWNDSRASILRTGNYTKAVEKYAGNNLKNTTFNTVGQVLDSSNQVVDIQRISIETGRNIVNRAGSGAKDIGNQVGTGAVDVGNRVFKGVAGMPQVSSVLQKMLGALPVAGIKDEVQKMAGTLKNTACGGGLKGCYMTNSGPLQLYFFTSREAQQTLLLVIDKKLSAPMPMLLGEKLHKIMANTELQSPIISISTTDYDLDTSMMPPDLQRVVRESYFNIDSLSFSSGVQLAARVNLGYPIKENMEKLGLKGSQAIIRAAVVMPIPTDLTSGAGAGAGMATAVLKEGDTMKKASADALKPDAFVELQFAPNTTLTLGMPKVILSDATFFITKSLTFGYKGNVTLKDMATKKNVLLQFQTPLTPAGVMDLADFSFRMATPANYNMQDAAQLMYAMASEDTRLMKYGHGFIKNIDLFKKPLSEVGNILAMFQLRNPNPAPQYRFGDSSKPWPDDPIYFNIVLAGPMAPDGPLMKVDGNVNILGQEMGYLYASAGGAGWMHATAGENLTLPLGPLGKVSFKMDAKADIDKDTQNISLHGNFAGQPIDVILAGTTLTLDVGASCVNPFEIKAKLALTPTTNLADVFAGQAGVNVDPSKLQNCIGKELEAAYNKIAGEYKGLSGYSAAQATQALKQIKDTADLAAAETAALAKAAATKTYNEAKDTARNLQSSAGSYYGNVQKGFNDAMKSVGAFFGQKSYPDIDHRFDPSVFNWDYYYDHNPDLVKAGVDLAEHWAAYGFNEGRRASYEFHMPYFRNLHQGASDANLLNYWAGTGINRGDPSSPEFSLRGLVARNADLQLWEINDYRPVYDWWMANGREKTLRDSRPTDSIGVGGGGSRWADSNCVGRPVTAFIITASRLVDGVQFYYTGGWAPNHGSGNTPNTNRIQLDGVGETITEVRYSSGDQVGQLTFVTSKGRVFGPYGQGGGSVNGVFKAANGGSLSCVSGRSGASIDELNFTWTK